jgi:hypothetical protein
MGLEIGSDDIAEIYSTNGETQSVKSDQGISVGIGGQFQIPRLEQLILRTTVGFKYVTTQADNAHIRLTRIPIQIMGHGIVAKNLLIGAGISSHQNIKFNADGVGEDISFDGAIGPIIEVTYQGVGLNVTLMN